MNRDDIIHMAREAGAETSCINDEVWMLALAETGFERFAALAFAAGAAAEREACAKVCEGEVWIEKEVFDCNKPTMEIIRQGADAGLRAAAAAIRARGQE
jgi:hypothetical protein